MSPKHNIGILMIALWSGALAATAKDDSAATAAARETTSSASLQTKSSAPPKESEKPTAQLSENQKIDALIRFTRESGVTFIRNETRYTSAEAADHLETKRKSAGKRIKTAQEFIEHIASKSSISGKAYQVETTSGQSLPAGEWLTKELERSGSTRLTN